MGFTTSETVAENMRSTVSLSTDHAERVLAEYYIDKNGDEQKREVVQSWAAATDGDRARPVHLFLESRNGNYVVQRKDGTEVELDPATMARMIFAGEHFGRMSEADVRPPLIVTTNMDRTNPANVDPNPEFLAELKKLGGPWQSYSYSGPVKFWADFGAVGVPEGARFTESPITAADVRSVSSGPVFGFPTTGRPGGTAELDEFAAAIGAGTAAAKWPWGAKKPLFVSVDGAGTYARVELTNGKIAEIDGRRLAALLVNDPDFLRQLKADPRRPVVLVGKETGVRLDIGGLGFDFAGALRKIGHFNGVYAPDGGARIDSSGLLADDGTTFRSVSGLRAGDLRTTAIEGPNGELVAKLVRSPRDEKTLEMLQAWGRRATSSKLRFVQLPDGRRVETPWDADRPPVIIFANSVPSGYVVERTDRTKQVGSASSGRLARVLRDDRELRDELGTSTDDPIMLVNLGGPVAGLKEFAEGMVPGGYSRVMYGPRGRMKFLPDGTLAMDRPDFERVEAITPGPEHLVSYALANAELGLYGQFFPSADFDTLADSVTGLNYSKEELQRYYRDVPERDEGRLVYRERPFQAPWAGKMPWHALGHGERTGFVFSMATGNPYRRGDVLRLTGAPAARAIWGSELFRRANPDPDAGLVLGHCLVNNSEGRPGGITAAYLLKEAWDKEFREFAIWAATETVNNDLWTGRRIVDDRGRFALVGPPGIPLTPAVRLPDQEPAGAGGPSAAKHAGVKLGSGRSAAWPSENFRKSLAGPTVLQPSRLPYSGWLGGLLRAAGSVARLRDNLAHAAGDSWKVWFGGGGALDDVFRTWHLPNIPVRHGESDDDDADDDLTSSTVGPR
jgi:hypothetical protein